MALEPIEMLNGILSVICVIISISVGLKITLKYFKYKQRTLLFMGIFCISVTTPWWPSSTSFLLALATGKGLSPEMYFLIGNIPAPFTIVFWLTGFTDLKYKEKQKIIIIIYAIIGILFEIYLIYYVINDPSVIGELSGVLDVQYKSFVMLYLVFVALTFFITGILFGLESLKSSNPKIRLKGKLLIAAFILWTTGGIMDAALPLDVVTLTIARLILISSAILFYFGYLGKIEESEEREVESIEKKEEVQDFLEMVAKHKRKPLTEEEVIFYRERKICLVCKGKALKYTYICQKCNALYCQNCAHALENLENACWVCNAPIDESKPVKPFKREEEEIDIEISEKPQKKPKTKK